MFTSHVPYTLYHIPYILYHIQYLPYEDPCVYVVFWPLKDGRHSPQLDGTRSVNKKWVVYFRTHIYIYIYMYRINV